MLVLVFAEERPASAQIWVVTDPDDGSPRFTTSPEPGAMLFMRTFHGARTRRMVTVDIPAPRYRDGIASASARTGLAPELITAVSNFNPDAVSSKGAQGLMQLMPATAASLGVRNVWDPRQTFWLAPTFLPACTPSTIFRSPWRPTTPERGAWRDTAVCPRFATHGRSTTRSELL